MKAERFLLSFFVLFAAFAVKYLTAADGCSKSVVVKLFYSTFNTT